VQELATKVRVEQKDYAAGEQEENDRLYCRQALMGKKEAAVCLLYPSSLPPLIEEASSPCGHEREREQCGVGARPVSILPSGRVGGSHRNMSVPVNIYQHIELKAYSLSL
jgi:hypothetical protein